MRIPPAAIVTILLAAAAPAFAQQPEPASGVVAAVPRMMWLSGVFRPTTMRPVAAMESVTVTIYRDREGGDALWRETQQVAMEPGGRYNLLLGSIDPDGLPVDLFTSGDPRWIGITFNRPGEVEQPRVPLASVPYALKAADADTLGGLPASAYLRAPTSAASRSPTGASSPSSRGEASGDVSAATAGTPGYLGRFVDGSNLGDSVLFQNGDSVALGTTVPRDMFHVSFTNGNGGLTGYGVQNLSATANAYSGMLFFDQNGTLGLFQGFNNATHEYRINNVARNNLSQLNGSINFMIGGTSRFLVASSGNIGIGVPVPGSKLDVSGAVNTSTHYAIGGFKMFGASPDMSSVFAGNSAGVNSSLTSNNSFFGGYAGLNTQNNHNTFIGFQSGFYNTINCCNTMLGAFTGNVDTNVPGVGNTLLGYAADFGATGLNNATAIGHRALVSQSDSLVLGSINGVHFASADTKVGIGTPAPAHKLHLSGAGSTEVGQTDLHVTGTGAFGSGITLEATGTGGRTYSWISTANTGGGGFSAGRLAVFDATDGSYRMVIDPAGNVGIGTFDPDQLLSVNGEASKIGGGFWSAFSDERLKHVKGPFTSGLAEVLQVQPIRYEYRPDNPLSLRSSGEHIGVSAQALQRILPEAVSTNSQGYLLVNNEPLLWSMVNAIQEQQREIQDQQRRAEQQLTDIRALQQQNADLQRRLAALEAALTGRR